MERHAASPALLVALVATWALLGGHAPARAAVWPLASVTPLGPGLYSVDQANPDAAPDAAPDVAPDAAPDTAPDAAELQSEARALGLWTPPRSASAARVAQCLDGDGDGCPAVATPSKPRRRQVHPEALGRVDANALPHNALGFPRLRRQPMLPHHHHQVELDSRFVHLPGAAVDNFPDSEQACEALRNASLLQKVLPVVVEAPCPVKLTNIVDPRRVWPAQLLAAECACAGSSCRARTAYVCTQLEAPVLTVTVDDAGRYHQHSQFVASGCRCMMARATMSEDDDVKK